MPARHVAVVVFVVALLAALAALAFKSELSEAERAACDAQGGCAVVSAAWLRSQIRQAFNAGFAAGAERARESATCKSPMT